MASKSNDKYWNFLVDLAVKQNDRELEDWISHGNMALNKRGVSQTVYTTAKWRVNIARNQLASRRGESEVFDKIDIEKKEAEGKYK